VTLVKEKDKENVPISDDTSYNDIPDYAGYCPDCEVCGETMGYSYLESEFKCPNCGTILPEDEWDMEDDEKEKENDDSIPSICINCGGPYPFCTSACNLFDS